MRQVAAAERTRAQSLTPKHYRDGVGNMTWSCYNGAFDEWLVQVGGMNAVDHFSRAQPMHAAFFQVLEQRYQKAKYRIISVPKKPDQDCTTVKRLTFRDRWLRSRDVDLVQCDNR